ncbi:MAG: acylphosphatase [Phycisphaeraceae bacterium]|nr:acylphosphatase [Phycisphaeraceae bacterium]
MVRYTVHYTGRVQGVGFRYTAVQRAENLLVAGYVQNMHDGSVRLVAEGEAADLDVLLKDIRRAMARNIVTVNVDKSQATGEFGHLREGGLVIRH